MYNNNGSLFEFVILLRFSQIWKQMGKSLYSVLALAHSQRAINPKSPYYIYRCCKRLQWIAIEVEEDGGEIALTCVWKENHYLLALVFRTLCHLGCGKGCGT